MIRHSRVQYFTSTLLHGIITRNLVHGIDHPVKRALVGRIQQEKRVKGPRILKSMNANCIA